MSDEPNLVKALKKNSRRSSAAFESFIDRIAHKYKSTKNNDVVDFLKLDSPILGKESKPLTSTPKSSKRNSKIATCNSKSSSKKSVIDYKIVRKEIIKAGSVLSNQYSLTKYTSREKILFSYCGNYQKECLNRLVEDLRKSDPLIYGPFLYDIFFKTLGFHCDLVTFQSKFTIIVRFDEKQLPDFQILAGVTGLDILDHMDPEIIYLSKYVYAYIMEYQKNYQPLIELE